MNSLKIGITGGIGSGKSTICKIFTQLGIPVYEADKQAKLLIQTHPEIKAAFTTLFGADIYLQNGSIDRKRLASIIFNDSSALQSVNEIVHPRVQTDFTTWANEQNAPYVLKEAAILFESGGHQHLDKTILVTANESIRIERVCKRDKCSPMEVQNRMKNQWPESKKLALADYTVHNENIQLIIPQTIALHSKLTALSMLKKD